MEESAYIGGIIVCLGYLVAGVRLARLSLKTRKKPERILAITFLLWGMAYACWQIPLILADETLFSPLYILARFLTDAGSIASAFFLRLVFRPNSRVATGLVAAIITGMLVFVPYVGMITGLVLATLVGLMQFPSVGGVIPVWIAFGIGQALEGMVVTPFLVGQRIGLHPVAVIFALLAFGQIFGFFGVLLALPASAALLVGLRHLRDQYLNSKLYQD